MHDQIVVKGKYAPLCTHLQKLDADRWPASFTKIEEVLGFSLPRSARTFQAWWANQTNSGSHTHAQSWQCAGWKARHVDLANESIVFERVSKPILHADNDSSKSEGDQAENAEVESPVAGGQTGDRSIRTASTGPAYTLFEELARWVMSDAYGVQLRAGKVAEVNKVFDMVSADETVVGDAKYFTMVGGERLPPAKFSVIAEHVWLLDKTGAEKKFLIFGNDRRVPEKWLEKYGSLVSDVAFFFLSDDGRLQVLNETDQ